MASGLAALLDDVAAIAKLAAASVDDIGAASAKAASKSAGVVIDDTAVTPAYVTGLTPDRELPIIGRIALGSLRNKLLILVPAALLLSWLLPIAITPILMLGGAYLCFEGAEKIIEAVTGGDHHAEDVIEGDADAIEKARTAGAIRTDMILSAEIIAIALADLASVPFMTQAAALVAVSFLVTGGVYGLVALIVKMDDIGLHLAQRGGASAGLGRALVHAMPGVLSVLSNVGMVAMLWVGGGILLHGLEVFHVGAPAHLVHDWAELAGHAMPVGGGAVAWLAGAMLSAVFGLAVGAVIAVAVHRFGRKSTPS